jgi:hypothetical protein
MSDGTQPTRQELTPPKNRPLYARFCDQTFAFSELARGLSSSANCLAFLPRSSLGWLFVGFPALQFTEKAFPLKLLFQNPECLIDIIVTNENFQSGFLSRLNSKLGTRRLLRCGLEPCRQSTCGHFVGVPYTWASARSCTSSRASES